MPRTSTTLLTLALAELISEYQLITQDAHNLIRGLWLACNDFWGAEADWPAQ